MIKLTTPLTVEKIKQLHAGDEVLLSGTIYTGRDAAHKRLMALIEEGKELPFHLEDQEFFMWDQRQVNLVKYLGVEDLQRLGEWMLLHQQ